MKKWLLAVFLASLAIAAFAWYGYRFPHWEETVVLPDGRSILVEQRRDVIEGYGTRRTWLTFSLPEMNGKRTWDEGLQPVMIGAADGKVYVVGRPRGAKQFSAYRFPRYVYVAFIWQSDHFERIPFLSVPESLRKKENVRWCLPGGRDSRESVQLEPNQRCSWPKPPHSQDHFPRPETVDLNIRVEEAIFWARVSGLKPSSE